MFHNQRAAGGDPVRQQRAQRRTIRFAVGLALVNVVAVLLAFSLPMREVARMQTERVQAVPGQHAEQASSAPVAITSRSSPIPQCGRAADARWQIAGSHRSRLSKGLFELRVPLFFNVGQRSSHQTWITPSSRCVARTMDSCRLNRRLRNTPLIWGGDSAHQVSVHAGGYACASPDMAEKAEPFAL